MTTALEDIDKTLFKNILNTFGSMSEEDNVIEIAKKEMEKYSNNVYVTKSKNLVCEMGNKDAKNHIMLDAHLDQICLIVTHICNNGFLKFSSCGGIDARILPGKLVKILSEKEIYGIIAVAPSNVLKNKDKDYQSIDELLIDVGLTKKEACTLIPIGTKIAFDSKAEELLNKRVVSKAIDNRASVIALLNCAKMLEKIDFKNTKLSILLSTGEEINAFGAKTGSYDLNPDIALAVDVSFATQPNIDDENKGKFNKGPMIGISPCICKEISSKLIEISRQINIPYQFEVMAQKTGTNADSISITKNGIKTGLVSIPIRYMHTMVETVDIKDIEYTSKLITNFVKYYVEVLS